MDSVTWVSIGVVVFIILIAALRTLFGNDKATPVTKRSDADDARTDLPSVPEKFVVFDLETTGLDPTRHEIIELGAIRINRDSDVHDTFQTLVKPKKRIPKRITRINGISQNMIDQDGEPLEAALRSFAEFIADLPLVSFNADFDMGFLRSAGNQHGIPIRNRVSCALTMARRAWPGRESYRLCDLARDGNLSTEDTHRALGDCKRTVIVYTAAASKLGYFAGTTNSIMTEPRQRLKLEDRILKAKP